MVLLSGIFCCRYAYKERLRAAADGGACVVDGGQTPIAESVLGKISSSELDCDRVNITEAACRQAAELRYRSATERCTAVSDSRRLCQPKEHW